MALIRGLAEIVIWVHDMDKALRFYHEGLGLAVMFQPDQRGAVFLQAGAPALACPQQLVLVPLPEGSPAFPDDRKQRTMHHLGLEIAAAEFESARERLQSQGYEVRSGEHPFLELKGLYVNDPDGNEVELIAAR